MKILVAHDGMGHSDAAMDSLAIAGLPTKGEAVVLHVFSGIGDSHGRNKHSESAMEVARKANYYLKISFRPGKSNRWPWKALLQE